MKLFSIITVSLLLFFIYCNDVPEGQFGWAGVRDEGIGPLEHSLLLQTDFRLASDRLFFQEDETIWWIYRMKSGFYDESQFLAALYSVGESPEPVEIDLRQVIPEPGDSYQIIRQYYEPLTPGQYVLKIAYKSVAISQVRFTVLESPDPWDEEYTELKKSHDDILHNYAPL